MIVCYFDGACEPWNPGGTASYGAVIFRDEMRIWECSKLFKPAPGREEETSNNVAEYSGFLAILEYLKAKGMQREEIVIHGDSNLVIQQMFGRWKMKAGFYIPVALKAQMLLREFTDIRGKWIPRDDNGIADELSKRELTNAGVKFRIQPK